MVETRKRAIVLVSPELLVKMKVGNKAEVIGTDVPADAKVQGTYYYDRYSSIAVVLESESFEPIPEGHELPLLHGPTMRALDD